MRDTSAGALSARGKGRRGRHTHTRYMAQAGARATIHAMIALCLAVVGCTPLAADRTTGGWRRPADARPPPAPPPPAGFSSVHQLISASRCSIYVMQAKVPGIERHKRSQYASHHWVSHSLASHPWRVDKLSEADVVYFNASLTLRSPGRYRNLGTLQKSHERLAANNSRCGDSPPAAIYSTSFSINDRAQDSSMCTKVPCRAPLGIHYLAELAVGPSGLDIVTPFVSSASLLADLPPPTPWSERKLLLVVLGRIINPALSTVRWHAWLALHSNPLATVYQYNLKGLWMGAACDLPTANGTRREVTARRTHTRAARGAHTHTHTLARGGATHLDKKRRGCPAPHAWT